MIAIASILESKKIDNCLEYMLYNINESTQIEKSKLTLFHSGIVLESKEEQEKFNKFKKEYRRLIENKVKLPFSFKYTIADIKELSYDILDMDLKDGFAKKFDIDRLLQLLKNCDALNKQQLRGIFISIYQESNTKNLFVFDS